MILGSKVSEMIGRTMHRSFFRLIPINYAYNIAWMLLGYSLNIYIYIPIYWTDNQFIALHITTLLVEYMESIYRTISHLYNCPKGSLWDSTDRFFHTWLVAFSKTYPPVSSNMAGTFFHFRWFSQPPLMTSGTIGPSKVAVFYRSTNGELGFRAPSRYASQCSGWCPRMGGRWRVNCLTKGCWE